VVMTLWENGYSFDYVSDRFLANAECRDHKILLGGNEYKVVVIPDSRVMPVTTLERLVQLANDGANIVFQSDLPANPPGFGDLERRRNELQEIKARFKWTDKQDVGRYSEIGKGRLIASGDTFEPALHFCGIRGEELVQAGLRFVRRKYAEGFVYFVANGSEKPVDKFVTLQRRVRSAVIFDPKFDSRVGLAQSFY